MALTAIVAYDVREDARRARLAALVQTFGDRIQYSVFVCHLPDGELADLMQRARAIIDGRTDSVYALRQCQDCWDQVAVLGQAHPPERVYFWAVL